MAAGQPEVGTPPHLLQQQEQQQEQQGQQGQQQQAHGPSERWSLASHAFGGGGTALLSVVPAAAVLAAIGEGGVRG